MNGSRPSSAPPAHAPLALAAALLLGCVQRSSIWLAPPPVLGAAPAAGFEGPAKLHLRDGRLVVLDTWRVVGDAIQGTGREYGVERELVWQGDVEVKVADVALVVTTRGHPNPALLPLALVTVASIAGTVLCITHPATCFLARPTP